MIYIQGYFDNYTNKQTKMNSRPNKESSFFMARITGIEPVLPLKGICTPCTYLVIDDY